MAVSSNFSMVCVYLLYIVSIRNSGLQNDIDENLSSNCLFQDPKLGKHLTGEADSVLQLVLLRP